jgi:hypothetical protein
MSDQPLKPRLLTTSQVAGYLGFNNVKSVANLVKSGIIPPPLPGTKKWDRHAVDAALDRAAGLTRQAG